MEQSSQNDVRINNRNRLTLLYKIMHMNKIETGSILKLLGSEIFRETILRISYIIFQKAVDNFEFQHKICYFGVGEAAPLYNSLIHNKDS